MKNMKADMFFLGPVLSFLAFLTGASFLAGAAFLPAALPLGAAGKLFQKKNRDGFEGELSERLGMKRNQCAQWPRQTAWRRGLLPSPLARRGRLQRGGPE